ncbi:hypothetical protein XPA_003472 [Xanthoria parietina]
MAESSKQSSESPQSPDRSWAKAGDIGKLDNRFDVDEKVWMRNPANGVFTWLMWVVEKRYDANKPGWEYKLKDKDDVLYRQGAWVSDKELNDA